MSNRAALLFTLLCCFVNLKTYIFITSIVIFFNNCYYYRSEQSYARTLASLSSANALAVPWSASEARLALPAALGVAGIPALVITDAAGKVLTANGRQHLAADPLGLVSACLRFPRSPNTLTISLPLALVINWPRIV